MVFTDGSAEPRIRATASLYGAVTFAYSTSRTASSSSSGRTSRRTYSQSSPVAAKAAFCIRGDNECDTGWPSSTTSVAVLSLVLEEVLVVRREVVVLVVRLAHEVEVVDLRGVRGRLERRGPGIVDRRRRQAVVHPRVVRRRVVQLGLRERLGRRDVEPVAERRVDAEGHLGVQPVVDDGGHERALARDLRLALDHGRDREHVVRREVLAPRVREVQPAPLRGELPELVTHELRRRRLAVEVVRVREEEALERQLLAAEAGDRSRPPRRR